MRMPEIRDQIRDKKERTDFQNRKFGRRREKREVNYSDDRTCDNRNEENAQYGFNRMRLQGRQRSQYPGAVVHLVQFPKNRTSVEQCMIDVSSQIVRRDD